MDGFNKKSSRGVVFVEARFYDNISVTRSAEHKPLFNFLLIPRVYRETENRAHVCPISWGVLRNPPGGTNATILHVNSYYNPATEDTPI